MVTAVVRCDPVVRGPDVAPVWPSGKSLEGVSGQSVQVGCFADGAAQRVSRPTAVIRGEPSGTGATGTRRARPAGATWAPAGQQRASGWDQARATTGLVAGAEGRGAAARCGRLALVDAQVIKEPIEELDYCRDAERQQAPEDPQQGDATTSHFRSCRSNFGRWRRRIST